MSPIIARLMFTKDPRHSVIAQAGRPGIVQEFARCADRSRAFRPGLLKISLVVTLVVLVAGCGTARPVLSVTPLQSHTTLHQAFTQAYTTRDAAGDYQIVLLDDPIDRASPGDAGRPLAPERLPPVRQVLQVRVLWRPVSGAKPDSPAATNASLHWYVLSGPTTAGTSMIHYAGTAFVAVVPNGPGAEITIHNGSLKIVERSGELLDPLKSFTLAGRFDAVADDARLRQIMDDVRTASAEARSAAQAKVGAE